MVGPVRYLWRQISLLRHKSSTKTAMVPLSSIKSVAVLLDSTRGDAPATEKVITRYFTDKDIKVRIFCPEEKDYSIAGYFNKKVRGSRKDPRKEELYISLIPDELNYAVWYDAICSPAKFKVGCCSYKNSVFDIVINIPDGKNYTQIDLFATMANCLERVI